MSGRYSSRYRDIFCSASKSPVSKHCSNTNCAGGLRWSNNSLILSYDVEQENCYSSTLKTKEGHGKVGAAKSGRQRV